MYNTTKRNSNIELLRIISMLFVVAVHYNGGFLDGPQRYFSIENSLSYSVGQSLIQGFTVCCVNCFLIISGFLVFI